MRSSATILGFVAAASLTLSPAFAGPANKPSRPARPTSTGKPTTAVKGGVKPPTSPRPSAAGKPPIHSTGKPTTSAAAKPTAAGMPAKSPAVKPTPAVPSTTATPGSKSHVKATTTTSKHAAPAPSPTSPPSTAPLNPIAEKLASKPNLSAKLTRMLPTDPATGTTMTLDKASLGFKNQGQFIAALHVSENLGIPFSELKSHMVTVTPGAPGQPPTATQSGSLGQAIQASRSTADAPAAVKRAESQADADLRMTSSTTTGSA